MDAIKVKYAQITETPLQKNPLQRSPKGYQHSFHIILIKMIPLGKKAGRGDTRHNIKSDTYTHWNLPRGKETAKGISQFIFLFFSLSLIAITSSFHWFPTLLAQLGRERKGYVCRRVGVWYFFSDFYN